MPLYQLKTFRVRIFAAFRGTLHTIKFQSFS